MPVTLARPGRERAGERVGATLDPHAATRSRPGPLPNLPRQSRGRGPEEVGGTARADRQFVAGQFCVTFAPFTVTLPVAFTVTSPEPFRVRFLPVILMSPFFFSVMLALPVLM